MVTRNTRFAASFSCLLVVSALTACNNIPPPNLATTSVVTPVVVAARTGAVRESTTKCPLKRWSQHRTHRWGQYFMRLTPISAEALLGNGLRQIFRGQCTFSRSSTRLLSL